MKKFAVIAVVFVSIYYFKPNLISSFFVSGAFDNDGNAVVWLFTSDNCGQYCTDVVQLLNSRGIDYQEFDANSKKGKDLMKTVDHTNRLPLTVVGSQKVIGNAKPEIISILAEGLGEKALTRSERLVMQNHFYEGGEPMVVMYGTSWCGFCKKMRIYFEENNIDYTEFDAEGAGQQAYNLLEAQGYPLMYVGYRRIKGVNIKQLEKAMADFDI